MSWLCTFPGEGQHHNSSTLLFQLTLRNTQMMEPRVAGAECCENLEL